MLAIVFGEEGGAKAARQIGLVDEAVSSNLLEAELRAAALREQVELDDEVLTALSWVLPDRPLTAEIEAVLRVGYLRGADLWHLACALYVFGDVKERLFLSLGERQRGAAERLGFIIGP